MMLILTGERGCGKSLLLKEVILGHGIAVQGFLSLKDVTENIVTGIYLLLLPDQEAVPMATTTPIETDSNTSRFYFYPEVFPRINSRFERLDADLPFVFDEFGLLEMHKKGHYPIFETLVKSSHKTLLVVRSEIIDDFTAAFCSHAHYEVLDMASSARENTSQRILEFLCGRDVLNHG